MNKRGQLFVFGVILVVALVVGGIIWLINSSMVKGSSVDIAYGVEQNSFWYKLYLKDDHKTIYCLDKDNQDLIDLAQRAAEDKLKVKVYYQEYWFRGTLCGGDTEKYDSVVVTKLEVLNE
jgi:hypothetical protein